MYILSLASKKYNLARKWLPWFSFYMYTCMCFFTTFHSVALFSIQLSGISIVTLTKLCPPVLPDLTINTPLSKIHWQIVHAPPRKKKNIKLIKHSKVQTIIQYLFTIHFDGHLFLHTSRSYTYNLNFINTFCKVFQCHLKNILLYSLFFCTTDQYTALIILRKT